MRIFAYSHCAKIKNGSQGFLKFKAIGAFYFKYG